jgi:hypothetical protein
MKGAVLVLALGAVLLGAATSGCNALVGNDQHSLAARDASSGVENPLDAAPNIVVDGGTPSDGSIAGNDAAGDADTGDADAAMETPGGPVPPTGGGIVTVARAGILPDGGRVTITDDGFEFGAAACSGSICVSGAITP